MTSISQYLVTLIAPNTDHADRLKQSTKDLEKAKNETRAAAREFQDCSEKRRKLFMDAFNHVAAEIDNVYKNLTKSERFPLGGNAYLNLMSLEVCLDASNQLTSGRNPS